MNIKNIYFKTYEDLRNALEEFGISESEVDRVGKHERAHFEEALRLGYSPVYGLRVVSEYVPFPINAFVDFDREPSPKDLIRICSAPENLSEKDLKIIKKNKKLLGEEK